MSKTASIYARVEPKIKEDAENILNQLGIPMSNAINIFLRQIILQNGLPFEVKISDDRPLAYEELTPEEFNLEIEKGFKDLEEGRILAANLVAERMEQKYGRKL